MAHLLLIESWVRLVGGTSGVLPACIRRMGHRFTFVARNIDRYRSERDERGEPHPVLALADRVVQVDTNQISALCEWAAREHASAPFDAVLTGCDFYLEAVARVARQLGLPGNDPRAIRLAYHKHLMREAEARHGLPGPRTLATDSLEGAQEFARSCGFPIVVKPTDLGGSELVRFVEDAFALESAFGAVLAERANGRGQARVPIVLLEEFMPGEEVSVETYTVSGRTQVIGITDKTVSGRPAFIETMHMFPAELTVAREREAVQAALATLAAIGYGSGLAHTEVKLTPAGARVVEVNARMAGNHIHRLIELTTGLDLFELSIRLALGEVSLEHELPAPRGSAAVAYLLPPGSGRIDAIEGLETLREEPGTTAQVCQVEMRRGVGDYVRLAGDNDDYIGHFVVHASRPNEARRVAEKLLGRVRVHMSPNAQ